MKKIFPVFLTFVLSGGLSILYSKDRSEEEKNHFSAGIKSLYEIKKEFFPQALINPHQSSPQPDTKTKVTNDLPALKPVISSKWRRIVDYPENHLNDFCIFRDQDKTWHAMGIMGTGTWDSEISLFHSTGKNLTSLFTNRKPVLRDIPAGNVPPQKHAPHVIYHNGLYYLFYRRPPGTIMKLSSPDPSVWEGLGDPVFKENDARDICIQKFGGKFYMYYCQNTIIDSIGRSAILLRKSADLINWEKAVVIHYDTEKPSGHTYLESPFVIKRKEGYFLFIRHRLYDSTVKTVVMFSKDPESFPSGERKWITELELVHAAEIVALRNKFYIARVSGTNKRANLMAPEKGGWVEIARLKFK